MTFSAVSFFNIKVIACKSDLLLLHLSFKFLFFREMITNLIMLIIGSIRIRKAFSKNLEVTKVHLKNYFK